jgi:hypothetical protein
LSKQVLWDILDTVDAWKEYDHRFDDLKAVLLGQFCNSKWKSYLELLRLPLGMDGIKATILMGKLKQLLPQRVSPINNLFLSMFLIRLPPSMRETVGADNR